MYTLADYNWCVGPALYIRRAPHLSAGIGCQSSVAIQRYSKPPTLRRKGLRRCSSRLFRAAVRVVSCSLLAFFEALQAHSSCSHLRCSNSGGA